MRRLGAAVAVALLVSAASATGARLSLPRSTIDRIDDISGPQVHLVYAVPSDRPDRALDTDGTIDASVAAWNGWLAGQTGGLGGLRIDTYQGQPDITFFAEPHTDAQGEAQGTRVLQMIEADLHAVGFNAVNKIYAVYYDGTNDFACGSGSWPPSVPGNTGAIFLHGLPNQSNSCDTNQIAPGGQPAYFDFSMLHEILHTLGFVATCAPHSFAAGHVSDSPNDLMYAGDQPWRPTTLDVGHDDYFQTGTNCLDLAKSPYLQANAPAPQPAPTPVTTAPATTTTATPKPVGTQKPLPPCAAHQAPSARQPCVPLSASRRETALLGVVGRFF